MLCITDFIQISIILVKFEKGSQAYVLDTFYQNERKVFFGWKIRAKCSGYQKKYLHKSSCGNIHSVSDTFCHMYTKEKNHKLHMSTFKTSIILQSKIFTEIAPSLHFVMFKRQLRCNSCSYILITFNKIIFFCMQFKWYKPTKFCLLP